MKTEFKWITKECARLGCSIPELMERIEIGKYKGVGRG